MKQISKKLSLKKKTVSVLNQQELSGVVGGKTVVTCHTCQLGCGIDSINVCLSVNLCDK